MRIRLEIQIQENGVREGHRPTKGATNTVYENDLIQEQCEEAETDREDVRRLLPNFVVTSSLPHTSPCTQPKYTKIKVLSTQDKQHIS